MTLMIFTYIVLWLLVLLIVPMSLVLLYLLAKLQQQFAKEGVGSGSSFVGRELPSILVTDINSGEEHALGQLFSAEERVVLALSTDCGACLRLIDELERTPLKQLAGVTFFLICVGEEGACHSHAKLIPNVPIFRVSGGDDSVSDLSTVAGYPALLIVDRDGIVVDLRHPLSIKSAIAAVKNARLGGKYTHQKIRAAIS